MTATPVEEIASAIETEDQALEVIASLRAKFDLSGTEFVRKDVRDAVDNVLSEVPEEVAEFMAPHYVQAILDGTYWNRLQDILAERGNEHLGDAAADTVGALSSHPLSPDHSVIVTTHGERGEIIQEVALVSEQSLLRLVAEVSQGRSAPGAKRVSVGWAYVLGDEERHIDRSSAITVWTA